MARFLSMLRLRGAPDLPVESLRRHLDALAARRGVRPWFDRFSAATATSDGISLHIDFIDVSPHADTLVFMPGTNAYTLLYGEFLTAVADRGINVVGFDPRGHGRSGGARGSYVLGELVRDMDAVVCWARQRFAGRVFVAGSSQGGIVSFYYAAGHTDVAGAICHNIADLADPASVCLTRFPRMSSLLGPLVRLLARIAPELPVPMSAYLDLRAEPVAGFVHAREILLGDPLTVPFVRLRTLDSLSREPLPTAPERIATPILVLQAEADTIFPTAYVEALARRIGPAARVIVYPGLPHYMIVDHVGSFVDDVVAFLRRPGAERTGS